MMMMMMMMMMDMMDMWMADSGPCAWTLSSIDISENKAAYGVSLAKISLLSPAISSY